VSTDLVLDLDDDDAEPGRDPVWWREVRVPIWIVALLVLAVAVVAVAATRAWDTRPAREIRPVTVLVNVPADDRLVGSLRGTTLTLGSALEVTNTGPQPITLRAVVSTSAGVALRSDEDSREIPAGTVGRVIVRGTIDCTTWVPTQPIEVRLDLTDAGGVLRPIVETVVGQGAWDDLLSTC
jgi:hypothetical protein